jgi:hypothetical protein
MGLDCTIPWGEERDKYQRGEYGRVDLSRYLTDSLALRERVEERATDSLALRERVGERANDSLALRERVGERAKDATRD